MPDVPSPADPDSGADRGSGAGSGAGPGSGSASGSGADGARPPAARSRLASLLAPSRLALPLCGVLVAALLAVAVFAPLPFAVAQPGRTVDVLGTSADGEQVVSISGLAEDRAGGRDGGRSGKLLMTTIAATLPHAEVRLVDVVESWFASDRVVMPHDSVYPVGDSDEEIERHNQATMRQSQDDSVHAALSYLKRSPEDVHVTLRLKDIGGPSAGLLFALGIIEKLGGGSPDGGLTGGETIAGTGTIEPDGTVGPVGGVPLKIQAAERDGATVFLVPQEECADAKTERPEGLRLIPVRALRGAVDALTALQRGDRVPSC